VSTLTQVIDLMQRADEAMHITAATTTTAVLGFSFVSFEVMTGRRS